MKIAIGNDHSGVDYKNELAQYLSEKNIEIVNVGTDEKSSIDYPDIAKEVSELILDKS